MAATEVAHEEIPVGYTDTVADLTAGLGGSLAAGLLLLWCALRHPPGQKKDHTVL